MIFQQKRLKSKFISPNYQMINIYTSINPIILSFILHYFVIKIFFKM